MVTIKPDSFGWRLGNQLFQIAAAYEVAKLNNTQFLCPKWQYADYFKVKHVQYEGEPISFIHKEPDFSYSPIEYKKHMALDGYFQSKKYFTDIHHLFEFDSWFDAELRNRFWGKNVVSVHVRRGDYLKYPDHHPVLSIEYYKKAIELFPFNYLFVVFSDDIEWCRENFNKFKNIEYAEGLDGIINEITREMEDFYFMSKCDHNIISNSTFSWWAAMLNKNENKIVVSPSKDKWHGKAYSHWNHDDIIPENWIQI